MPPTPTRHYAWLTRQNAAGVTGDLHYAYGKARKVIVPADLTFYDMRHSAASRGTTGATTAELKAMKGHATPGMVERYQDARRASRSRLA